MSEWEPPPVDFVGITVSTPKGKKYWPLTGDCSFEEAAECIRSGEYDLVIDAGEALHDIADALRTGAWFKLEYPRRTYHHLRSRKPYDPLAARPVFPSLWDGERLRIPLEYYEGRRLIDRMWRAWHRVDDDYHTPEFVDFGEHLPWREIAVDGAVSAYEIDSAHLVSISVPEDGTRWPLVGASRIMGGVGGPTGYALALRPEGDTWEIVRWLSPETDFALEYPAGNYHGLRLHNGAGATRDFDGTPLVLIPLHSECAREAVVAQ